MPKLIGLDLGSKYTGIAISDSLQTIAFRFKTVLTINLIDSIKQIINTEEAIEAIIIGENLYQNKHFNTQAIQDQLKQLCEIKLINEDFSTSEAEEIYKSLPKKEQKGFKNLKDAISAQIILQRYIDQKW